jgi:hypothetical protein
LSNGLSKRRAWLVPGVGWSGLAERLPRPGAQRPCGILTSRPRRRGPPGTPLR